MSKAIISDFHSLNAYKIPPIVDIICNNLVSSTLTFFAAGNGVYHYLTLERHDGQTRMLATIVSRPIWFYALTVILL